MAFVLCSKNTFVDEFFTDDVILRPVKSEPTWSLESRAQSQELIDYISSLPDRAASLKGSYVTHRYTNISDAQCSQKKRPSEQMQTLEPCHTIPVRTTDAMETFPDTDDEFLYDSRKTTKGGVPTMDTIEPFPDTDDEFFSGCRSQMATKDSRAVWTMGTMETLRDLDDEHLYDRTSRMSTKSTKLVPTMDTIELFRDIDDPFGNECNSRITSKDNGPALTMDRMEPFLESRDEYEYEHRVWDTPPCFACFEASHSSSALSSQQLPVRKCPTKDRENAPTQEVAVTTLMLCNLPCKLSQEGLAQVVDELGFTGTYDLIYLPLGFDHFLGYGFINFCTPEHAKRFASAFQSYSFYTEHTVRHVKVQVAKTQGLVSMLESIKRSANFRKRSHTPLIFSAHRAP